MKTLLYIERASVCGGLEVFAERRAAVLRTEGQEVEIAPRGPDDFAAWDRIEVHKCADAPTLERFPPEKTTLWVHDHEPLCPRCHAYTPCGRNCVRRAGLWPCLFCAPLSRHPLAALGRVLSQKRRLAAMRRLSKFVVLSQFMKSRLVAIGIPAERIEVRPPMLPSGGRSAPSAPTADVLPDVDLLYVGQLLRSKGVQVLLRAMALAKKPRTLDVVGSGNFERRLRSLARKLGVADRVRFRGWRPDPQAWMRAARCVVVPSTWQEPYGLAAAEAVALGRPVIASAVGGLPEACGGRATLVPPGDPAALAAVLDALAARGDAQDGGEFRAPAHAPGERKPLHA